MSSLRRLLVAASLMLLGTATTVVAAPAATSISWTVSFNEGESDGLLTGAVLRLADTTTATPATLADVERWGTYLSPVRTIHAGISQLKIRYVVDLPAGSAVQVALRVGASEAAWQPWQELSGSGATLPVNGAPRVVQLRVVLLGKAASPSLTALHLQITPAATDAATLASEQAASAPVAPTYRIFATREGLVGHRTANGHIIRPRDRFVALPSWTALARRGGYEYQVRLTYKGRTTVVPVWDVGPWNTRDDYWGPVRQRYPDLPVGLPMAHAAYHNGYNGGRDEFGRRIRLPNGIDIADGAFWDDLGMTHEDYVEVSFLWLGRDPLEPSAPDVGDAAAVVDNGRDWYDATPGEWFVDACGLNGNHNWAYTTAGEPTNRASWRGQVPQAGVYEVLAYVPACGPTASNDARYQVSHDGAQSEVVVDQLANQGRWVSLGAYHFGAKAAPEVSLSNQGGSRGRALRFDAIKWVALSDKVAPESRVNKVAALPDGGFLVRWEGKDALTGIAGYDVQYRQLPDGAWTDWHLGASIVQDRFIATRPGDYGFRVRARDWAGNVEPWPESHDADTVHLSGL